jgi:hypothetical protein
LIENKKRILRGEYMYSLFYKPRYANSRIVQGANLELIEIDLFKNRILDIYRRNATKQSLTQQEYEIASKSYSLIKERSQLTKKYIDVIWREIQMWDIKYEF